MAERDLLSPEMAGLPANGSPSPSSVYTMGAAAPSASPPSAPAGITPLNTTSNRDLLTPYTGAPTATPSPPAPATVTPSAAPGTAPVVSAPTVGTVGTKSTVAGQMRELLSSGSPYIQQAQEQAKQAAGARGLQNSSIAVQSGQQAAISAALPIAQQDANTFAAQDLTNQQAQNQFGLNQQSIQGQSQLQKESSMQRMAESALQGDIQSRQLLEQAGYNFQLSAQDNISKLQQLSAQGDISARLALQQFGFQTDLLSQEGRQQLETVAAQGDQSARLALLDANYRSMLMDKEAGINLNLEDKRFQQQQQLLVDEYSQRLGLDKADSALEIERMNVAHQQTLAQIAAQAQAMMKADFGPRLQAQYLASVSDKMNSSSNEIAQIYQTQGLTSAQQQAAVASAQQRMKTDLSALQAYYQQSPLWDDAWGTGGGAGPNVPVPIGAPPGQIPYPGGAPAPTSYTDPGYGVGGRYYVPGRTYNV